MSLYKTLNDGNLIPKGIWNIHDGGQDGGCQMQILPRSQNSPHKMFLLKNVVQYVIIQKINDTILIGTFE